MDVSLHPRERTIRGRMTSGHPASARAAPWYVPSRTFSPRQRLRLAAGGRHAKWHCVHVSTRARASTPLATVALKSKRQGARVVRRLAVVWVGVGGLSGGDPARLVDMTPYRRPAAPCWRARLAPVGVGTPYHTCSQRVLHSLTPGRRAGRDVGLVGHVPAVTSSP